MKGLKINKKIALSVVVCLLIVLIVFVVCYKITKTTNNKELNNGEYDDTVIQYGDKGESVKVLQQYLNAKITFYYFERGNRPQYNGKTLNSLDVDGVFGDRTLCATQWWFKKDTVMLSELQ